MEYPKIATAMKHTFRCKICGRPDNLGYYPNESAVTDTMREKHLCHKCAFWWNEVKHPSKYREIVGGKCYIIVPAEPSGYQFTDGPLGGADKYVFTNNWDIYRSFAVSLLGEIPKHFRKYLPDTARFITCRSYRKLAISKFRCSARGCWDRYHCLRYDTEIEKNGAYNVVPESHKPGDEHCPSFINPETELFT